MQTSTKWIIGGVVGAGALYLLWPKTAAAGQAGQLPSSLAPPAPAPLMAIATQPGAMLFQPDPNSMKLLQAPTTGGAPVWAISFNDVVSLGGNVVFTGTTKTVVPTVGTTTTAYPASGPAPAAADAVAALRDYYAAVLPTSVNTTNPSGGNWTANYTATLTDSNNGVITSKTITSSVPLNGYPSSGAQPPTSVVDNAVYADILAGM